MRNGAGHDRETCAVFGIGGLTMRLSREEPYMNDLSLRSWRAVRAIFVVATILMWSSGVSAQLKVLISGGFSGPYDKLLPEFECTTGIRVATGSGSSQGTGP